MDSEPYSSDEGEGSANSSMEMFEVSEDGGATEEYESEHEEYESEHEPYNSTVIESPGGKTKLWQPFVPKEYMSNND
ncbi:hypothetical protein L2E82_28071 [Cichorium intybus]|uniref:Uncharacterized protein n=2 Tax=Cichorium intybus TaxID=13427 RepID=A0ACB9CUL7_CICIN|nr:hypothetical protein L2E82_33627 [Cichorium intybus]KAI3738053.1 hypothetical protein L2E82_28071 [Cichorium intybus]